MENAVEALKMAAAALIFIIAIGTSFYMFGLAKTTADSIIGMRDKQSYLEVAELDGDTGLYVSSSKISEGSVSGVTENGDRKVEIDDVISTLYRYAKESYAVTIMSNSGEVLVRFDSSIEHTLEGDKGGYGWTDDDFEAMERYLKYNLKNSYGVDPNSNLSLKYLYKVTGNVHRIWSTMGWK